MKRVLILLSLLFCNVVFADTINLHWLNEDGTTYQNSTCAVDSDLNIPTTPPTKYGYTFTGWKILNYVPIEYLESTGTQWIDTGVVPNQDTDIEVTFEFTNSGKNVVFGVDNEWLVNGFSVNWDRVFSYDGQTATTGSGGEAVYTPYIIYTVKKDGTYIYVNNILKHTFNRVIFNAPTSIKLFLYYRNGTITRYGFARMYLLKIYDNSTLVRDFIPVLDMNGVPCLFDRVESKFYYNQGTGQFIAGPVLQ